MEAQWENVVMSSLMLYIDNKITSNGGYVNHSGKFYKTQAQYNQLYSYSLPYKQIISDASISGASVMQGVNVTPPNGSSAFRTVGEDGLTGILHHKGTVLFNSDKDSSLIEGTFAVKEYNIYITTKPEEDLLFKTAKQIKPKIAQTEDGLDPNTEAYPAIFLKNMGGTTKPLGFGRVFDTISYVRAIILASSAFSLDAVCGLLKKSNQTDVPLITSLPFNAIGAFTGNSFDYASSSAQASLSAMIWDVSISKIMPQSSAMGELNLDVFAAFVDFEVRSMGSEL